jgi:acetate kinase
MTHKLVAPGDDTRAAERVVALITRYAVRFDPVDRITFYSGIVRGLAPIRADLAAQMRADDIQKD